MCCPSFRCLVICAIVGVLGTIFFAGTAQHIKNKTKAALYEAGANFTSQMENIMLESLYKHNINKKITRHNGVHVYDMLYQDHMIKEEGSLIQVHNGKCKRNMNCGPSQSGNLFVHFNGENRTQNTCAYTFSLKKNEAIVIETKHIPDSLIWYQYWASYLYSFIYDGDVSESVLEIGLGNSLYHTPHSIDILLFTESTNNLEYLKNYLIEGGIAENSIIMMTSAFNLPDLQLYGSDPAYSIMFRSLGIDMMNIMYKDSLSDIIETTKVYKIMLKNEDHEYDTTDDAEALTTKEPVLAASEYDNSPHLPKRLMFFTAVLEADHEKDHLQRLQEYLQKNYGIEEKITNYRSFVDIRYILKETQPADCIKYRALGLGEEWDNRHIITDFLNKNFVLQNQSIIIAGIHDADAYLTTLSVVDSDYNTELYHTAIYDNTLLGDLHYLLEVTNDCKSTSADSTCISLRDIKLPDRFYLKIRSYGSSLVPSTTYLPIYLYLDKSGKMY